MIGECSFFIAESHTAELESGFRRGSAERALRPVRGLERLREAQLGLDRPPGQLLHLRAQGYG